jgi:sulfur relay (sulfurtransferase) DsrC/TusE family protein
MARKKFLFDWTKYAANKLVTAVVANDAKQSIVMTFKDVKPFTRAVYTEFSTSPAKTVDSVTVNHSANTVTVHVTVAFANGNTITCTYNPTRKGDTVTIPVTNNIA